MSEEIATKLFTDPDGDESLSIRVQSSEKRQTSYFKITEILALQTTIQQYLVREAVLVDALTLAKLPLIRPEKYYICRCESCGFTDTSENFGGDSGMDDSDVYCPKCYSRDCGEKDAIPFIDEALASLPQAEIPISDQDPEKLRAEGAELVKDFLHDLNFTLSCAEGGVLGVPDVNGLRNTRAKWEQRLESLSNQERID